MFRRERPQSGRSRQFHQIGAELIGRDDPVADAEVVTLLADCLAAAGVRDVEIVLNSLGDARCRPAYRDALAAYGRAHEGELCANCRQRLERNPLRLLDCKEETCRRVMAGAPLITEHLCDDCRAHLATVERLLEHARVPFVRNARLVRGLDYYCGPRSRCWRRTSGRRTRVGGGGRYDGLVEALGGPAVPGIGFALGVERLIMAAGGAAVGHRPEIVRHSARPTPPRRSRSSWRAGCGAPARAVELEPPGRSVKSAMRRADKLGVRYAVVARRRRAPRRARHACATCGGRPIIASPSRSTMPGPRSRARSQGLGEHVDA